MTETTRKPISRRTMAKGAAWTAPVILGGVAAPAYAASGGKPTITPGGHCKQPGNSCNPIVKGYVFTYRITNTSSKTVYLYTGGSYGPTISTGGVLPLSYAGARVGGTFYPPGTHIPIPAGASVQLLITTGSSNSADLVFTFTVGFQWGHTPNPADDTEHVGDPLTSSINVAGTPPCENCAPPANPQAAIAAAKKEEEAEAAKEAQETKATKAVPTSDASTPAPTTAPTAEPTASQPTAMEAAPPATTQP